MADNFITKFVRLILDPKSAKKTEEDAKQSLGKVDTALQGIGGTLAKIGAAIAAAFTVKKILDFGVSAVQAAIESEKAWASLGNTINNVGDDFDALEPKIRATANAFADATIHDDDEFAQSLQRLIVLTGDTEASLRNMGLAANVAAAFFDGDLSAATELIAKVMNGNIASLKKLGIEAKDAQEAIDLLAKRSAGAAEKELQTFGGQVKSLGNAWGDFKKEIGLAIIGSNQAESVLGALRAIVMQLIDWVHKNRDAIREWVTDAINFAIQAADVLYRAISGMIDILEGGFYYALGIGAKGIAQLTLGFVKATEAAAALLFLVSPGRAVDMAAWAQGVRTAAEAINDWADAAIKAGSAEARKGLETLSTPIFTPTTLPSMDRPGLDAGPPLLAREHKDELDKLAEFDAEYWKKRIGITKSSAIQIRAQERDTTVKIKEEFSSRQETAVALGSELADAMLSGLGPTAAWKAKQNLIEAAELGVRALVASLNPFTAWQAPQLASAAAQHVAIAGAWAALASTFGGGGGDTTGGGSMNSAGASAGAAGQQQGPSVQVTVYVDGIDPDNTRHQGKIAAINQQVKERYGENSSVTVLGGSGA